MRAHEVIVFAINAAAGTYGMPQGAGAPGYIEGGRYLVLFACTGTPSLQVNAIDGSGNVIKVGAAFVTVSGGSFEIALPPGQVQIVVATSTANYVTLARIPND